MAATLQAAPWKIDFPAAFYDGVEEVRRLFGLLINAPADNVAITHSASHGLANAAAALAHRLAPSGGGDNARQGKSEVIVLEQQYVV